MTMHVYCVYPAISKSPKHLKKNSKLPMSEFFGKKPSIGCYVSTTYI
jgi:hypothetical protein